MAVKEFREFYLRAAQVGSGTKADQEVGFAATYTVTTPNGSVTVGNRFLQGHYPSEAVFRKLLESITFKLNSEDKATDAEQGLVQVIGEEEAANFNDDDATYTKTVKPHHLPRIEVSDDLTVTHRRYNVTDDTFEDLADPFDGAKKYAPAFKVELDTQEAIFNSVVTAMKNELPFTTVSGVSYAEVKQIAQNMAVFRFDLQWNCAVAIPTAHSTNAIIPASYRPNVPTSGGVHAYPATGVTINSDPGRCSIWINADGTITLSGMDKIATGQRLTCSMVYYIG